MASIDFNKWDEETEKFYSESNQQMISQLSVQINNALGHLPDDANILWRSAKIANLQADFYKKDGNSVEELSFVRKALTMVKKAIECDPHCVEAHIYFCVCLGRLADSVPIKERFKYGHEIKKHSEFAFSLNSNSNELYILYLIYGVFSYRLSTMSWIEKKLANAIYGELPIVTLEDGLTALIKGLELKPTKSVVNYLWICKILIAKKEFDQANQWMEKALTLDWMSAYNVVAKEELIQLKKKYLK